MSPSIIIDPLLKDKHVKFKVLISITSIFPVLVISAAMYIITLLSSQQLIGKCTSKICKIEAGYMAVVGQKLVLIKVSLHQ